MPLPGGTSRGKDSVRLRTLTLTIALTVLAAGIVAAPAMAGGPSLHTLKQQLRHAKQSRQRAGERARAAAADLAGARELFTATHAAGSTSGDPAASPMMAPVAMDPALAAALLADGMVTADEVTGLEERSAATGRLAHLWTVKSRRLQHRVGELVRIERWNRRGQWKQLIEIAGKKYGVSRAGLYRMMTLESNGQRFADSGPYHGLFQFMDREWAAGWNEWRDHSIYDGWSQIQLAAKAISRGMGPSIWPLTYRMSF
jgi:hypothetical protein